jgi:hypothetical protein
VTTRVLRSSTGGRRSSEDMVVEKCADQAHQVWLAEQVRGAARVSESLGWRRDEDGCRLEVSDYDEALEITPEVVWFRAERRCLGRRAYAVRLGRGARSGAMVGPRRRPPFRAIPRAIVTAESDLLCVDDDGEEWWVLHADHRLLIPREETSFPFGSVLQAHNGGLRNRVEATLSAGRQVHLFVRLRSALAPADWRGPAAEVFDDLPRRLRGDDRTRYLGEQVRTPPAEPDRLPCPSVDGYETERSSDVVTRLRCPSGGASAAARSDLDRQRLQLRGGGRAGDSEPLPAR